MSFWDSVKKFAQPYGDDDYDDYDDEYLDEYEEEPVRRTPGRRSAPVSAPAAEEDLDDDFGFDMTPSAPASTPAASTGFNGRVVSMNHGSKQEVILFRPAGFNDTSKAADDLRAGKAIVLNMENVDKAMTRRVVDFLSGCVYAIDGSVKKIAQAAYLFCPSSVDVVGDLESIQAEIESYI